MVTTSDVHSDGRIYRNIQALNEAYWDIDLIHISNLTEDVPGSKTYRVGFFKSSENSLFSEILIYLINILTLIIKANVLGFSHRYTIVFVNNMPNILVLSGLVAKFLGARVILDIHDPFSILFKERFPKMWSLFKPLLKIEENLSIYLSDALITVNLKMQQLYKIYEKPLLVLHNAPNISPNTKLSAACFEGSKAKIKLVFAGNVHKRTGLFELLQEFTYFEPEILDRIEIDIWGYGPFLTECQRLVDNCNIRNIVRFKGKYSHNQIEQIYSDADFSLAPNPSSTFNDYILPVKVLESLSFGVPVIGHNLDIYQYYAESIDINTYQNVSEIHDIIIKILAENPSEVKRQVNLSLSWDKEKEAFLTFVQKEMIR